MLFSQILTDLLCLVTENIVGSGQVISLLEDESTAGFLKCLP